MGGLADALVDVEYEETMPPAGLSRAHGGEVGGLYYLSGWRRLGETGCGVHGSMWSRYCWVFMKYPGAHEALCSGQRVIR